jgi:hypothetical protein
MRGVTIVALGLAGAALGCGPKLPPDQALVAATAATLRAGDEACAASAIKNSDAELAKRCADAYKAIRPGVVEAATIVALDGGVQ